MEVIDVLSTIGMAAAPVGELRFAIPWAVVKFDFTWYQAMTWAFIGNLIPVLILPWVLHRLGYKMLSFPQPIRGLLVWRTDRLRSSGGAWFSRYGRWALIPFVATPLPFTGAWTGVLAAWAFDIHPRKSIPMMVLGVLGAAIIVTTLTELGVSLSLFLGRDLE